MSEALRTIGRDAFYGCHRLTRVMIPDSVTMIEEDAFYACSGLKSVTFGKSLTSIETFAFSNCDKLKNVTFMGDAPDLGNGVFRSVPSDCTVWVSRNSTGWDVDIPGKWQGMNIRYKDEVKEEPVVNTADFDIKDGVLRGTKLRGVDEIIVPSGVKSVCIDGLVHSGVKTLIIPEGVKHIGRVSGGYYPGTELEEVRLPASVSSLDCAAFDGHWRKLWKIEIASGSPYVVREGCLIDTRNNTLVFALPFDGKIVAPDSIKVIGEYAFNNNSAEEVVIPNSVVKIGRRAFDNCRQLKRISLPVSVADIGKDAFSNCGSLVSIDLAPSNGRYATKNGLLIDMKTATVLRAFGPLEKAVIPDEVKTIGEGAFSFLQSLTSMTVPDTVNRIEDRAFSYCNNMTELRLPARVNYCSDHFIMGCKSLTSVQIPMGMTELAGNYSIGGCKSLRELVLPKGLQHIGDGGLGAVCECDMLERIYIPASVTRIASGSGFAKNPSLREFDVDSANMAFCSDSGVLFSKAKTRLIRCPEAKEGVYTIPNTVLKIDERAFDGCRYLMEIRIPDSVKEIGYGAFKNCTAITNRYHSTAIEGENKPNHPERLLRMKESLQQRGFDVVFGRHVGEPESWKANCVALEYDKDYRTITVQAKVYSPGHQAKILEYLKSEKHWLVIDQSDKVKLDNEKRIKCNVQVVIAKPVVRISVAYMAIDESDLNKIGNLKTNSDDGPLRPTVILDILRDLVHSNNTRNVAKIDAPLDVTTSSLAKNGISHISDIGSTYMVSWAKGGTKFMSGGEQLVKVFGHNADRFVRMPYGFTIIANGGMVDDSLMKLNLDIELSTMNQSDDKVYDIKQDAWKLAIDCTIGRTTLVIGGPAVMVNNRTPSSGRSILRSAPILNRLVADSGKESSDRRLVIMICPEIVDSAGR